MSTDRTTLAASHRLSGLDAARVWGTLLVVLLHAAVPYIPEPMPGLYWPVDNRAGSSTVAALFWSIESFIMPLFFVISGVGSCVLLERRGAGALLANRRSRILLPLLTIGLFVLFCEFCVWTIGDVWRGNLTWKQALRFSAKQYDPRMWGLAHLWYLQYLLMYTLLTCGAWKLFRASRMPAIPLPLLAALPACAAAAALSREPQIVTDFEHSFLPIPTRFAYFGIYFAAGLLLKPSLECTTERTGRLVSWGLVALGLAGLMFATGEIRGFLSGVASSTPGLMTFALTASAVGLALGIGGLAIRSRRPMSPGMSYVAGAAFWVYLVHHGLCGVAHLLLDAASLSAGAKFALAGVLVLGASLGSYHGLVRGRWLDRFLNGGRPSPGETPVAAVPAIESSQAA